MPYKFTTVAFIAILQFAQLYSQTPSFYHYTSSDGLASSTVYDIIQDKEGFIWFATTNGMSKFDGKRFTTFRSSDGLNSNSIISLLEGKNGELYIGNFEKGINVFRNGHIENYISQIEGNGFVLSYLILGPAPTNEQNIFAYSRMGKIYLISEKKSAGLITKGINTTLVFIYKMGVIAKDEMIALTTTGLYSLKDGVLSKLQIKGLPDADTYCLFNNNDGSYFVGAKGMIYRIKNDCVIDHYKINVTGNNEVVNILKDCNNNIWFSIMNMGFYLIPNSSGKIVDIGSKMDLQKTLVNKFFEDREDNIWISTFGKGVFCINNLYIKSYNEKDGLNSNNVYSISKNSSGKLLIGTFTGINILENGKIDRIRSSSDSMLTDYIYSIKNYNDEFVVSSASERNYIKNISYKGINLHLLNGLSFSKLSNGLFLLGTRDNTVRVQKELEYKVNQSFVLSIFGDTTIANRINEIYEDSEKNVWIGTGLGLCKINHISLNPKRWTKSFFPGDPVLNFRINSIAQDYENNVWFAGEKGIACYNLKKDSVTSYKEMMGHDLSSSTSVVIDKKGRLWIGNMKGLYLFDGHSIKHLNRQTGLPSDEIYALFHDFENSYLYVGTSDGISILDINQFDSYVPRPLEVKIAGIKAGDSLYVNYDHLVFTPEQNHVYIDLQALSFSSPGSVSYKYNINDKWIETDHDFLDVVSLKGGNYRLQVMAKSQNTDWSKPLLLSFRVLPRFVDTIWFTILIILSLGFFSVLFMIWLLKYNSKKSREEFELAERINVLKHQALSAMMNPHFIFNALNSVQYLINCMRNEEANDYIAMMAKLVRKNLETAGHGFILLADEIVRLKLYLNLERLRFQENFSYEIVTGTDVDAGILLIPNMIIQPFVENTLWHGIINANGKGLLTISFSFEEVDIDSCISRALIIKVTDNGIGIVEAKKQKKEDHISKGIEIVEERLRLLSAKMHLPKPIMLEDLSSRNSFSHGTEVIISLPSPLYKIIGS
ncbi:MAG: histidine kinase [Prolixibacteraceae bacterium]|jgi:ligand-binding sensor domain-containing protein|nr:histidine kinase [Prolixibacteraceae bacterium]